MRVSQEARQVRDLAVWGDARGTTYVAACDVNAGVGERTGDFQRRPPEEAGYNVAKVALMEVLASGADPIVALDSLCLQMDGYGRRVVDGVRRALDESGRPVLLLGSDETNMTTVQTGVGITVIGAAGPGDLLLGSTRPGAVVVCVGVPKDGVVVPYREGEADVAGPRDVLRLRASGLCQELLPVGSRGVGYELGQLAAVAGLSPWMEDNPVGIDLARSAGASTCLLASLDPDDLDALHGVVDLPLTVVGRLHRTEGTATA